MEREGYRGRIVFFFFSFEEPFVHVSPSKMVRRCANIKITIGVLRERNIYNGRERERERDSPRGRWRNIQRDGPRVRFCKSAVTAWIFRKKREHTAVNEAEACKKFRGNLRTPGFEVFISWNVKWKPWKRFVDPSRWIFQSSPFVINLCTRRWKIKLNRATRWIIRRSFQKKKQYLIFFLFC